MKKRYLFIISIILIILDTSFSQFISIKGVYPSLIFIFAVAYSIITNPKEGIIIGIISGALQDIFFYKAFGINLLANIWICYIAGIIGENVWKKKRLVPFTSMFGLSILKYLILFVVMYALGTKLHLNNILYYSIYNSVIILLVYGKLYNICNDDNKEHSWRFNVK